MRRPRPRVLAVALLAILSSCARQPAAPATSSKPVSVFETPIADLRKAMEEGRTTSHDIVQQYLTRIALYEDRFNATLAVNPNALKDADERDKERAQGKVRGPLHGIPIALKDNIHTTTMPTTGGAVAFEGLMPPYEATLTKNLRDAGAIIIAKTNMTELANWVAGAPTPMPGNYNGLGGYGLNPYDPRRDPREQTGDGRPVLNTGGSSSGAGTAANFWAANVGTETSGSILSPANQNMLAAIKPTVGRVSRYGVIPITRGSGHSRPDGEIRVRRGHPLRRARGCVARSERSGDDPLHAAAKPRLHAAPEGRRPQGRAHRHSARVLLRAGDGARHDRRTRRTQPGSDEGHERGHRHPQAAGRGHRRSRGHSERRRYRPEAKFPDLQHLLGRRQRARQGRELLHRLQVRHEARLQCVAGLARPGRAVQDADRPPQLQHGAHVARHDQVRAVATRHLGRDEPGDATRRVTKRIAPAT